MGVYYNPASICFAAVLTYTFDKYFSQYMGEDSPGKGICDILFFIAIYSLSIALYGDILRFILIIMMAIFIVFIYYDMYRFKECGDGNKDIIIYPFMMLSLYFYLNQYIKINEKLTIRKLADCTYSSFAKTLMLLCIMLSLSYRSTDIFIFSTILFFYMLST